MNNEPLDDDISFEMRESSFDLLFAPHKKIDYIKKDFDFKINPSHFLRWLKAEGEEVIRGNYKLSVSSMCEYSCLYIAMMLSDKQLQSRPKIYSGNFGFFDHYWIGYVFDGQEYFIDLTLMQFVDDAPKLAISLPINEKTGYRYDEEFAKPIDEYLMEKRAFQFYIDPRTIN